MMPCRSSQVVDLLHAQTLPYLEISPLLELRHFGFERKGECSPQVSLPPLQQGALIVEIHPFQDLPDAFPFLSQADPGQLAGDLLDSHAHLGLGVSCCGQFHFLLNFQRPPPSSPASAAVLPRSGAQPPPV